MPHSDPGSEPHRTREEQSTARADHCTHITLSLVIPAYNESTRLPPYLQSVGQYFRKQLANRHEVIVVDDGSSDHLSEVVSEMASGWNELRVIRHARNQGKGAAIRTGMLASRGERILFADADGATPIEEEYLLREAIDSGADVAVGSRLIDAPGRIRSRIRHRAAAGRAFASLVQRLFSIPVADTQCGFKMFRSGPGRELFQLARENGYLFDIEVLARAGQCNYRIAEVPIHWSDQPGSHLSLWRDGPGILVGLWRVHRRLRSPLDRCAVPWHGAS